MKIKIVKQIEAKKHGIGALFILLLFIGVSISVIFIIMPESVQADTSDYYYYKQITIESDMINASLTNLPVLVHDATGDLLGDVLSNASDIAFYDSNNVTQYNHEIERYNSTSGELWAWVNVTSISSTTDTVLNMCYDDSDGGYPVGYNPTSVWDSDYMAVWHFGDVNDSTSNDIDLNNNGAVAGSSGVAGDTFFWNGTDYMNHPTFLDTFPNTFTAEIWFKPVDYTADWKDLCGKRSDSDNRMFWTSGNNANVGTMFWEVQAFQNFTYSTHGFLDSNEWYYSAVTYADNSYCSLFVNTSKNNSGHVGVFQDDIGSGYDWIIGGRSDAAISNRFNGTLDEVRVSQVVRNESWIWASFNSTNETTGFITLGSETVTSSVSFVLNSNTFTHVGQWGDTSLSNETGTYYEWAEFNITYGGTNISYIRINITDIDANITSSNCSYQFTSDNTSWNRGGNWWTGSDGGFTIILNDTTYTVANGCYGVDPFPFTSSGSIWMVERITIPSNIGNETYSCNNRTWDAGYYS